MRRRVVLPVPFGPKRVRPVPLPSESETSSRAGVGPYVLRRCAASTTRSDAGGGVCSRTASGPVAIKASSL